MHDSSVRRTPWLAWIVILACVALFAGKALVEKSQAPASGGVGQLDLQARLLLAGRDIGAMQPAHMTEQQLADLEGPGVARGLRLAILRAALMGPEHAIERLDALPRDEMSDGERRAAAILRGLFSPPGADWSEAAAELSDDDAAHLRDQVGWLGLVAVAPPGVERRDRREELEDDLARTKLGLLGMVTAVFFVGSLGLVVGLLAAVFLLQGKVRPAFAPDASRSVVLVETFAVYMGIMAIGPLAALVLEDVPGWLGIGTVLTSGLAIFWPMVRGLSWPETRTALGWSRGKGVFREIGAGLVGYLAGIPILAGGILLTFVLVFLAKALDLPADASHPITGFGGEGVLRLVVLLSLASVMAPLLEETFFRGALYPAFRTITGHSSRWLSVAVSAIASGVLFAAVHPQSWIAIPALASLGVVFAIAREWRGSLIAPMTIHAVSNGLTVTALWFLTS